MATVNFYPSHQLGFIDASVAQVYNSFNNEYRRWTMQTIMAYFQNIESKNHRSEIAVDFYIPADQRIDSTIYNITSVALKLYVWSLAGGSPQSTFQLYLRNEYAAGSNIPLVQIPNDNTNMGNVYNGGSINYLPTTSLNLVQNSWLTINLLSSFYTKFFTYQTNGFIGLVLKRTTLNNALFMQVASELIQDGSLKPVLEVQYERKQEPATVVSFDLQNADVLKYVNQIPARINVRDSEQDSQTLVVEGAAKLGPTNDYAPYTALTTVESATIPSSDQGTITNRTVNSIFRVGSLATPKRFKYHADVTRAGGAVFVGNNLSLPPGASATSVLFTGLDLKPSTTYRFGVTYTTTNQQPRIYVTIAETGFNVNKQVPTYNASNPATYYDFNSGNIVRVGGVVDGYRVTLRIDSPADTTVTVTGVTLVEVPFDTSSWNVLLRARVSDNDGTSNTFVMPRELVIDGRAPTQPVITDGNGAQHEVFRQNPNAFFNWTESQVLGGVPLKYYRWLIDRSPFTEITTGNSVTKVERELEHTFPWDDKWYLHVAGEAQNDLIGQTAHFGFWYNVPAEFNAASGIYCNNFPLTTDSTTWINHDTRPQFSWYPPEEVNNLMRYQIQVGVSGGIQQYTLPSQEIDWRLVPANVGAFMRIQVHDSTGILYLDKNTLSDQSGWEVFKADLGTWVNLATELNSLGRTNLPKNLIAGTSDLRYTNVRYKINTNDHIPDEIPLYIQTSIGYYNPSGGNYVWSQFAQHKRMTFTTATYADAPVFTFSHTVPNAQYMTILAQLSQDNFVSDIDQFASIDYFKSFTELYGYSQFDKLLMTFKSSVVNEVTETTSTTLGQSVAQWQAANPDKTLVSSTPNGTLFTIVYKQIPTITGTSVTTRATGVNARAFSSPNSLSFGNRYNPNYYSATFACFFKAPVQATLRTIMNKGATSNGQPGFNVKLDSIGRITTYFGIDGSRYLNLTTDGTYQDNVWHHCAVTWDRAGQIRIWIDGVVVKSGTMSTTGLLAPSQNFYIGRDESGAHFNGSLDDIVFTHRIMSDDEIKLLASWVSDEVPLGLERTLTAKGSYGDGNPRTVRMYADRGISMLPGAYKWRYKKTVAGVVDPSFTTSASNINLAANTVPSYSWVFQDPEIDVSNIDVTYFRPVNELALLGKVYYVRMRIFDGFENGDWTKLHKFRINRKPIPPTNLFIQ